MQYAKGFILTLVILVISVGCSRQNKNTDTEVIVPSVQVVSPVRGDVENYYVATGELEALKSVEVSSEITGRIAKLNTDEGKHVSQGMVVAEMDDSTQKAEYAQALASLERMKAEWTKIQTGARPQELATAEQALLEAQSNYSLVSTDYIRIKNLYEQGVSSRQELDSAENQLKVKKSALQRAQENLSLVREGARKEDRESVHAALLEAQAVADNKREQLRKTKIRSPIDGIVTARLKQQGNMVSGVQITPIFRIEKIDPIKAVLKIPQEDQFKVKMNQPVNIVLQDGSTHAGKVSLISPAVDIASRSVKVEALIPNKSGKLKPGLFVEGKILLESKKGVLTIPTTALQKGAGGDSSKVFVVRGGVVRLIPVATGIQQDGRIEVTDGITDKDPVVITGFEKIIDGDKVQISVSS